MDALSWDHWKGDSEANLLRLLREHAAFLKQLHVAYAFCLSFLPFFHSFVLSLPRNMGNEKAMISVLDVLPGCSSLTALHFRCVAPLPLPFIIPHFSPLCVV